MSQRPSPMSFGKVAGMALVLVLLAAGYYFQIIAYQQGGPITGRVETKVARVRR